MASTVDNSDMMNQEENDKNLSQEMMNSAKRPLRKPPHMPKKIEDDTNYPDLEPDIRQFHKKTLAELIELAKVLHIAGYEHLNKQDLIFHILKYQVNKQGFDFTIGVVEIMESGFGFLRQPHANYMKSERDIYISPAVIKSFRLRKGDTVAGFVKEPRGDEKTDKFKAMTRIVSINYMPTSEVKNRKGFETLTPIYPDVRFDLENPDHPDRIAPRILNLFAPIGTGQRSLIVAPPRTGKTILLQDIANSIVRNHPEIYLIVLLIDERPEEVTDMSRSVRGEVVSSTFDEEPEKHCHVAEIVLEKAKRLVECKFDVVILLDSITRLARAYNQNIPASGKVLSGGVDAKALIGPKKFFGAARNIEEGGSLTIIGTALIDTGSRMDEVIFEEFKGTGNMEIILDRSMSEKRIFPAMDIFKSGTRKEELLLTEAELSAIWFLREQFGSRKADNADIMKLMIEKLKQFKTNSAFLKSIKYNGGTGNGVSK